MARAVAEGLVSTGPRSRREVLAAMIAAGAIYVKEGGSHTVYRNPRTGAPLMLPRHEKISGGVAASLIKAARK